MVTILTACLVSVLHGHVFDHLHTVADKIFFKPALSTSMKISNFSTYTYSFATGCYWWVHWNIFSYWSVCLNISNLKWDKWIVLSFSHVCEPPKGKTNITAQKKYQKTEKIGEKLHQLRVHRNIVGVENVYLTWQVQWKVLYITLLNEEF